MIVQEREREPYKTTMADVLEVSDWRGHLSSMVCKADHDKTIGLGELESSSTGEKWISLT